MFRNVIDLCCALSLILALVAGGCGKGGGEAKKEGEADSGAAEKGGGPKEAEAGKPDLTSPKKVLEAYYAAVEKKDQDATFALMTDKCRKSEETGERSFNFAFFKMGAKVKSWEIEEDKTEDAAASVRVKTTLFMEGEGEDKEPMRFKFVKKDGKWLIDDIG